MNASASPQSSSKVWRGSCQESSVSAKPQACPLPLHSQLRGKAPHTSWRVNLPFSSKKETCVGQSWRNGGLGLISKTCWEMVLVTKQGASFPILYVGPGGRLGCGGRPPHDTLHRHSASLVISRGCSAHWILAFILANELGGWPAQAEQRPTYCEGTCCWSSAPKHSNLYFRYKQIQVFCAHG